jgi:hypothetical protein
MKITSIISILTVIIFYGCSPKLAEVHTDFDKEANFSAYETFGWSEEIDKEKEDHPLLNNSLVKKRIKSAIKSEMEGRGYVFNAENPDIHVNFHIIVEEKTEVRNMPNYGYRMWWGNDVRSYNYNEGTLIIDLIDNEQNQLVWQGYSSGVLKSNPEAVENKLRESISLIFQEYEYRAQS